MHWTRIYDFFLIIPSCILNLFIGSMDKATEYIGFLISPLMKCLTAIVLLKLFQTIMTKSTAFWATLIFMIHPLPLAEAVLFFCYHNDEEKLKILYQKNIISMGSAGVIVFLFSPFDMTNILCLVALFLISYFTLKKYRLWHLIVIVFMIAAFSMMPHQVEYDKISIVHVVLYMYLSVFFGFIRIYNKRIILVSVALGCVVGVLFLYTFPKFFYGMEANVTELLKSIWLGSEVDELKSPFHFGKMPSLFFSLHMMISSVAIYNKIHDLTSKKFENMDVIWWIFIVSCACYQLFAIMADRMRPMYACLGIPLMVDLVMNGIPFRSLPNCFKIIAACVLSLFIDTVQRYYHIMPFYLFDSSGIRDFCILKREDYYQEDRFFKFLNAVDDTPRVILTYLGKSAMTLYYTKHKVVAAPYHRQEQGILAFFSIFERNYNESEVKKILLKTKTSYIFLSKTLSYSNPKTQNSLVGMVIQGNGPDWISIVDIPAEFEDVLLIKIDHNKLHASITS